MRAGTALTFLVLATKIGVGLSGPIARNQIERRIVFICSLMMFDRTTIFRRSKLWIAIVFSVVFEAKRFAHPKPIFDCSVGAIGPKGLISISPARIGTPISIV